MKDKLLILSLCLITLTSCTTNPFIFPNYCQIDYWGDSQFNIFGRKNIVGSTGRWIDYNNGRDGYWCTSPRCLTYDRVVSTDTCSGW